MIEGKQVKITDTTLRDGHQSLLATRMKIEDILPICSKIDEVGYYSLEVWGGATFDTCLRFLDEDPWERLTLLRKHLKTPLQMLLRGQNIVGYKNYPDDVLIEFIKRAFYHGINIFRIFDALNDVRNLSRSIEVVKQEGAHAQATVVYTISPVHNVSYYLKVAKILVETGADSLCLKDMAGILTPQAAFEIFKTWKENLKVPLQVHSHYTGGFASMSYLKAIEAGVDIIDCAISSLALQTSQPATETMVIALKGTPYDPGLNLTVLREIAAYFQEVRKHYAEFDLATKNIDPNVILYQLPGGMISNFISQLTQQNALDKLPEVLAELPRVREDLGYPPLVTPTSQIVGTQALFNVLFGRYKMPSTETKQYLRGYYGLPPGLVNEKIRQMVIGNEKPITCRPADLLPPGMEKAREEAAPYNDKIEDVISVALFPQAAICFLKEQQAKKTSLNFDSLCSEDDGIHYI
ncbi:oxaloacetate decarboxylase [Peptococcaceae bacterium SCADC1_2_3]|jgi:oxaloacetate decarboxylase alpha subunit|nr:oxaloacetate decarboxylase [Peptococcaceae bacterium SCADC1_2_3]KFI36674.1 oxaloacetate decarboxylase [Peptococcaceae bacterium SCADC1_2_3]KFI38168.1 oxaloacetate decarboxylase [Peptococcaceae bacterium SCADC1_2_3]HBQ28876.1 oxaloacetate decarboxylase subunit alpha [Desulfotomaculum sp.]HCJ78938.1 oxaloacetate decarboxylase subunit alpha [Desulfotomaculum sp.]